MTTNTTALPSLPGNPYEAADWLVARHDWPRSLVARVILRGAEHPHWLDQLADAVTDLDTYTAAWRRYEDTHPAPSTTYATDADWEAWEASGPTPSEAARALNVMSGGEARMCRLVATLHPTRRVNWHLADLEFDERGAAFFLDWAAVALTGLAWDGASARALNALLAVAR
ncbi:hypothetical protein AB1046_15080 [Promicromonospora sp. Populi]|uniref:hypothetical protein n=1 Tax=Promicromonospora sp. Populi TaxID=3239420 RepID=UPI0034E2374D